MSGAWWMSRAWSGLVCSSSRLFSQQGSLVIQLVNDLAPDSLCWSSQFSEPSRRNDVTQFKDKERVE